MSKHYVDDSIRGVSGALAGKNCTIKSHEYKNGINTIVFKWTADDGTVKETKMDVHDGTPILDYRANEEYKYGDIVIYAAAFYRCINDCVAGEELDGRYFEELNSPDGNYDIIQDSSQLPAIYRLSDRKMFYSIDDGFFWLWNGTEWEPQQPKTISNEELDNLFF